jgi:hypothetical protein
MQGGENMVEAIKFIHVMLIFLFLFLVAMNVDGTSFFLSFSNFRSGYIQNILAHFNNILLFSFSLQHLLTVLKILIVQKIGAMLRKPSVMRLKLCFFPILSVYVMEICP